MIFLETLSFYYSWQTSEMKTKSDQHPKSRDHQEYLGTQFLRIFRVILMRVLAVSLQALLYEASADAFVRGDWLNSSYCHDSLLF